jgi:hypothetical protein
MAVFGAITLALGLATGAAASGRTSVTGALLLGGQQSDFLAVQADSTGGGGADGSAVYRNGGLFVRVHITCMLVRADHTVVVGGSLAAGGGSGTIFPFYAFVLQDNGPGAPDKFTLYHLFLSGDLGPCAAALSEAVETAVGGNIVIRGPN